MTMPKRYTEAHEIGRSRGWEHANHAEHVEHRVITDSNAEAEAAQVPGGLDADGYSTGYRDGIDQYQEEADDDEADPIDRQDEANGDLTPGSDGRA